MNKIETYAPGSFCWGELATTDLEAGKKFYNTMFGWQAEENPMPEGVYVIFKSDGNDAGAMYQAKPGMPPHWGLYFSAENVDRSATKAETLGGKVIMQPFDVGPLGRMAVVQDPQGAMFSLWQPKEKIGATHPGPLNRMDWPELHTPDPAAAVKFYSGLFGWQIKPGTDLATAPYAEWMNDGKPMGGLLPKREAQDKSMTPYWMIYVSVADCDERAAKVKDLGGKVFVPPTDIPNTGRFAVISDPQGAMLSIIQLARTHESASV